MIKILYRAMRTPDGTVLETRHQHDYKEYTDANGEVYMMDGGPSAYGRRSGNKEAAELIRFTTESPIEEIREYWSWGSYGVDGDEPLHYIKLKDMVEAHIQAICDHYNPEPEIRELFIKELRYREG